MDFGESAELGGGNGMATGFGLVPLWGLAQPPRIAPVSRETIRNCVARHSLALPRSF